MRSQDRTPTWQTNLKWLAGVLLTLSILVFAFQFALSRLSTAPRAVPLMETILSVTLLPGGGVAASVEAPAEPDAWEPGSPLQLLAGVEVYADATEVPFFTVTQARERIAGVLTGEVLASGRDSAMALVSGTMLAGRLEAALDGPARQMITSLLASAMLDSGIGDGSRMADWPTQLQQQPGQPVQPIVGLLVRVDAELVSQADATGIGMLVLEELAAQIIEQGIADARGLVANNTLLNSFDAATTGPLANSLHGLFGALLLGSEADMRARLDAATETLAGTAATADDSGLVPGLPGASELSGLSPAEADRVVLSRLAEITWAEGVAGLTRTLSDDAQLDRASNIGWLLERLDRRANRTYVTRAWLAGAVSVILALILAAASTGWGRLFNPGLAILAGAGPALLAGMALQDARASLQGMERPQVFELEGGISHAWRSLEHVLSLVPQSSVQLLVQDMAIIAGVGALLAVLALLGMAVRALRPRRGRL